MALEIVVVNNAGLDYVNATRRSALAVAAACSGGYRGCAMLIDSRGKVDIARSGKFGARWQEGLRVDVKPKTGNAIDNTIVISHNVPGAKLFEFGGTVQGRPLLWIPLSFSDAKGRRARGYPGGLFRVNRSGRRPLLFARSDKKPKFVGVPSVTIRQRWHLRDIALDVMTHSFIPIYNRYLNAASI